MFLFYFLQNNQHLVIYSMFPGRHVFFFFAPWRHTSLIENVRSVTLCSLVFMCIAKFTFDPAAKLSCFVLSLARCPLAGVCVVLRALASQASLKTSSQLLHVPLYSYVSRSSRSIRPRSSVISFVHVLVCPWRTCIPL